MRTELRDPRTKVEDFIEKKKKKILCWIQKSVHRESRTTNEHLSTLGSPENSRFDNKYILTRS